MRQHIALLSFVFGSGYLVPLKAQWVLDNRCRRRLDVSLLNASSTLGMNRGQPAESTRENDLPFLTSGKADNAADDKEDYWYNGLRGRSVANNRELALGHNLFVDDPSSFMMHMHFQEGNCWQGEWIERRYCMECEAGDSCEEGNKLWTKFCDNSAGQKFVWVPNLSQQYVGDGNSANTGQLKLAYFDLCLERMSTNTFQMQKCDGDSPYQMLVGWHPTQPFELHPVEKIEKCINQHHHPRPEEEIANTACETARRHHTNLWKVYQNDNAGNEVVRMRPRECSRNAPCGKCEGDCDTSDDCEGDLICVQRSETDGQMPVPGCQGIPNTRADYCASPEDLFAPPIPNHGLRIREPTCTPFNSCGQCEGDCDSDNDCKGSMKCFMRSKDNADEGVPNCEGEDEVAVEMDFCYEPDQDESLRAPVFLQLRPLDCGRNGKPCLQCQGDCDKDEDCFGPLKCFQRGSGNRAVPGCQGQVIGEVDYCHLPEGVHFPISVPIPAPEKDKVDPGDLSPQNDNQQHEAETDKPLRLDNKNTMNCNESPCSLCVGDCDNDNECEGSLVCFQRPWHKPYKRVPGCKGKGVPGADYCVEP